MERTVLVLAGGQAPLPGGLDPLGWDYDLVVAADSGARHASDLGVSVDVVVGDLDSISPDLLAALRERGALVEEHPADKDTSDLELALAVALERGAERLVVVGADGGRVDHLLANALLLASPRFSAVEVVALAGLARIDVVRTRRDLEGSVGDVVTLLPVHGPAIGVWTEGLRFPLHGEHLEPGSTRGLSNELLSGRASVRLEAGVLLLVSSPGAVRAIIP